MYDALWAYIGANGMVNTPFVVTAEARKAFDDLPAGESSESVIAEELKTGQRWRFFRDDCSANCFCAARAFVVTD